MTARRCAIPAAIGGLPPDAREVINMTMWDKAPGGRWVHRPDDLAQVFAAAGGETSGDVIREHRNRDCVCYDEEQA